MNKNKENKFNNMINKFLRISNENIYDSKIKANGKHNSKKQTKSTRGK